MGETPVFNENDYVAGNPRLVASGLAIVLSGCSGGGKSTLLTALAGRGHAVHPEAGRQIVREQMHLDGDGLPWRDALKFVELAASRVFHQFNTTQVGERPVFFDRSLVDLVSFLDMKALDVPAYMRRAIEIYRFSPRVFLTPPWREIYVDEAERSKSFEDACREYDALVEGYLAAGYDLVEVPRSSLPERVSFIVAHLPR
ncbi:AAA family ATPase [Mesorhizobium sp. CAU 1741]|uniref:AAA family ATPase n=1 Tax=Mesorhizobium sp. CAU 1741 TaxID=3140366 RepID=UPI00325B04D1